MQGLRGSCCRRSLIILSAGDGCRYAVGMDPLFARIQESFARQRFMALLGASLSSVKPGEVEIRLPWKEELAQQHGFAHAGAIASIVDSACGYSALTLMPEGAAVLSIEFKVNLLAPAAAELFVARGKVIRAGRTITVTQGEAAAVNGGKETPIALMQASMIRVENAGGKAG